jgi:hypothetical protein
VDDKGGKQDDKGGKQDDKGGKQDDKGGKQDNKGGKQNSVDEGSERETSAKQVKINISTFVLRKTLIQ